jgi:hypothetical protein
LLNRNLFQAILREEMNEEEEKKESYRLVVLIKRMCFKIKHLCFPFEEKRGTCNVGTLSRYGVQPSSEHSLGIMKKSESHLAR